MLPWPASRPASSHHRAGHHAHVTTATPSLPFSSRLYCHCRALPASSAPISTKVAATEAVIMELGLAAGADTIVRNVVMWGMSNGERKCVSIGESGDIVSVRGRGSSESNMPKHVRTAGAHRAPLCRCCSRAGACSAPAARIQKHH